MNYTKGEWKVYMTDIDKPRWEICARENGEIGVAKTIYDDDVPLKEKEANANLIAAAPLGYELAKFASLISATWLGNGSLKVNEDDYLEIKRLASDFLAKAEGREP